ncbi:MAG: CpXC domain-containing protein [Candidatus Hodarchaeota archaeon]
MTILNSIEIKCQCHHVFDFGLPISITTWLYPVMVQTLVDGGYYQTTCPECGVSIVINSEIMMNTPKGIVMVPTGPPEKLKDILHRLEIVDDTGTPFSSEEISERLEYNMEHLDENPILKKQQEMQKFFGDPSKFLGKYKNKERKRKKKKRFKLF